MTTPSHSAAQRTTATDTTTFERLQQERRRLSRRRWFQAQIYDIRELLKESRVPLLGLIFLLLAGTLYLRLFYTHPEDGRVFFTLANSIYLTFLLMLGESGPDLPGDLIGRVLFFALPVLGLIFVVQSAFDFGRRLLDKEDRKADWQVALASTSHNHVIICGLGRVSYRVMLQLLDSGNDVVVIEMDNTTEFVQDAYALNVPVIEGDARNPYVLQQAGIERAVGLIAGINNDLLNIEIGLAARRVRPDLNVVMRIFDDRLDQRIEASKFGHNSAFSSSALAAPTLAAAAVSKGIRCALPLEAGLIGITEIEVSSGTKLESLVYRIEQEFKVQLIGYLSRDGTWNMRPSGVTGMYPGDRVLLMGTLPRLAEAWRHSRMRSAIWATLGFRPAEIISPDYNRVIVCGLGRVSYRMVRMLVQIKPRPEVVVIMDRPSNFTHEVETMGVEIIHASPAEEDVLLQAGIEQAYSVAAITSDPLLNLKIGLTVRKLRPDVHLVLQVANETLAGQFASMFGDYNAYSSAELAAPTLAAASLLDRNAYAIALGEKLLATAAVEVVAGDEFAGYTIRQIRERSGIIVAALRRYGECALAPLADQIIQPGDSLTLLASIKLINQLLNAGATPASFKIEGTWNPAAVLPPDLVVVTSAAALPAPEAHPAVAATDTAVLRAPEAHPAVAVTGTAVLRAPEASPSTASLLERILAHKRIEVARRQAKIPLSRLRASIEQAPPVRDFAAALRLPERVALIAEVKKASPSRGVLLEKFNHLELARTYANNGAAALSVLTDVRFFQGSLKFLEGIRCMPQQAVPLLRKDFMLNPYQIYEARVYGADAVLLIVAALDDATLCQLLELTHTLGMHALVEVHTAAELERALAAGARIIGVNNRDLHTFETSLHTTVELAARLPAGTERPLLVSESGIFTAADVVQLRQCGVDAVLVGEALVTAPDIGARVRELAGIVA